MDPIPALISAVLGDIMADKISLSQALKKVMEVVAAHGKLAATVALMEKDMDGALAVSILIQLAARREPLRITRFARARHECPAPRPSH